MQLSLTHRGWLAVSLLALPIVGGGACGVGFRANEAAGGTGGEAPGSGAGGEATSSAGGSGTGGAEGGAGGMGGEPGEGGQGGDKGEGGRARDACPAELPGPALVEVPGPNGAFCMDAHEVTAAQYAAFVAAGPALSTDATCGWNTT